MRIRKKRLSVGMEIVVRMYVGMDASTLIRAMSSVKEDIRMRVRKE